MANENEYNYRRNSGNRPQGTHRSALDAERRTAAGRTAGGNSDSRPQTRAAANTVDRTARYYSSRSEEERRKSERKYVVRRAVVLGIALALIILIIVGIVAIARSIKKGGNSTGNGGNDPVMSEVAFEAGQNGPAAEQLLTDSGKEALAGGATVVYETDISQINFHVLGNYKVSLIYTAPDGNAQKYAVTIKVVDTVPPTGVARDRVTAKGAALTVADFIDLDTVRDETDVSVRLVSEPDYDRVGVQTVDIILEDRGGNQIRLTASLTVTEGGD